MAPGDETTCLRFSTIKWPLSMQIQPPGYSPRSALCLHGCTRTAMCIENPILSLRVTRSGKSVLLPSIADLDGIVSADIPSEFPTLRDRLIFELPYRCGLRASEISNLNVSSVDLKRKRLVIQGRRGCRRYIHLPEFLIGVLVSYLPRRQAMGEDSAAPLVVNLRGGRLTTRSIAGIAEK